MEVGHESRSAVRDLAGRRSLGGLGRSAGPDGRGDGTVGAKAVAEALAILMVDLVEVLDVADRGVVLERLANLLDDQGRTPGGSETATLLSKVGAALIRLEC